MDEQGRYEVIWQGRARPSYWVCSHVKHDNSCDLSKCVADYNENEPLTLTLIIYCPNSKT